MEIVHAEGSVTIDFNGVTLVDSNKYTKLQAQDAASNPITGEDPMNPFVQFGFTTLQRASEHDAEEKIGPLDYSNDPMNYDDLEAYKRRKV